ncbi:MAG: hypothetical protein H8D67_29460 [Deltaproteobacteria bacterium]|nr:hypothetical protein [Deltaproteobacteria bacterium]
MRKSNINERLVKDSQWMCEHALEIDKKYGGKYIAVVNRKVIAHDKDFNKMIEMAKEIDANPLVELVPIPGGLVV